MSAQVYPPQTYVRAQPNVPHQHKRAPFTNSNAVNHQQPQVSPQKNIGKAKGPPSPPLPRQASKAIPPTPPQVISDKNGQLNFHRVGFLGEGGFARVYEVKDVRGIRFACKVVSKGSLKTKKAKTKLYAEIKIHRSLDHPNIVKFQECFEDEDNVYMTLELCHFGSVMDMLRRRRRFTEPEARYFMVQLLGACHYMHTHQVIHRDLKLGNLFLDSGMNIKVGDFGLAALIENPGERKKTICGTPNYIAPEVLFDTANGHSFEVDTWSIGVILYTLVVGRPPFQTTEVKEIYKKIRDNDYEFPSERAVSAHSRALIQQILTPDPQMRPTLYQILDHEFFTQGIVPGFIPTTAQDTRPDFRHVTRTASEQNLKRLRRNALLDEDQVTKIAVPKPPNHVGVSVPTSSLSKSITSSLAQQEKEFQKAVQPGSPISALLSSARQPLVMSTTATRESPLMRKLQAAARESPLAASARNRGLARGGLQNIEEEIAPQKAEDDSRKKLVESQKARIVAQMAPVREEEPRDRVRMRRDIENVPPSNKGKEPQPPSFLYAPPQKDAPLPIPQPLLPPGLKGFDAAAHVLSIAFEAKAVGKVFRDPQEDICNPLPEERVFIVSWVDYCNKYGMGYALTDGSVGVHFNDTTSLVLSPDKKHFDYIYNRRHPNLFVRKSYTVETYPEDLKSKVYLLKHFERYILDRLYGEYDYTFEDVSRTKGMEWVQKYLRMKHVIIFKLSHDVLQFNFYDHSKVILSSHGLLVTHIDKHYNMTRWPLSQIMSASLEPSNANPEQAKFHQRLVDKVKYCKEVLLSIKSASSGGPPEPEDGVESLAGSTRTSKTSLR